MLGRCVEDVAPYRRRAYFVLINRKNATSAGGVSETCADPAAPRHGGQSRSIMSCGHDTGRQSPVSNSPLANICGFAPLLVRLRTFRSAKLRLGCCATFAQDDTQDDTQDDATKKLLPAFSKEELFLCHFYTVYSTTTTPPSLTVTVMPSLT